MVNQTKSRMAILACLAVISVLLVLNLRYNAFQTFAKRTLYTKKNGDITTMVESDRESTYTKDGDITTMVESDRESTYTKDGDNTIMVESDHESTYNKELQNLRQKGLSASLEGVYVSKLSSEELRLTVHSYLDNTEVICRRKLRMGSIGDGGWEICDDPDVRPRPPCIIYSFGINYDFTFDDDASRIYGCHVYSFDPSMKKFENKVQRSNLTHFYKIGLSNLSTSKPKEWKLKTLGDIRTMLGHNNVTIDIIKMDIESSEWLAIPEMIRSGQLKTVRQLMVEYHVIDSSLNYLMPRLQVIQDVEKAGFKRYYVHKNPACVVKVSGFPLARTMCYEVHYIRK